MAKKRKEKKVSKKKNKKKGIALGISGFTLGIERLSILVLCLPITGRISSIVRLIVCNKQQKNNPTKFGKKGITLNTLGIILNLIWWILLIQYLVPLMQNFIQNNPALA